MRTILKTILAAAFLVLLTLPAAAQNNVLRAAVGDYGLNPSVRVQVVITLIAPNPRTVNNLLIRQNPVSRATDTNGYAYFTNILWGDYRLDVVGQPSTPFNFRVYTNTTGSWDIASLVTNTAALPPDPATNYYTVSEINSIISGLPGGSSSQYGSANLTNWSSLGTNQMATIGQLNGESNTLYSLIGSGGAGTDTNRIANSGGFGTNTTFLRQTNIGIVAEPFLVPSSLLMLGADTNHTNVTIGATMGLTGTTLDISTAATNGFQRALQVAIAVANGSNSLYSTISSDIATATNGYVRQLQVNNTSNSLYVTVESDIVTATNNIGLASGKMAFVDTNRFGSAALLSSNVFGLPNIRVFGALGGANDDTVAFQNAINAGGAWIDPRTNYTVGNLYLSNNVTLIGGGTVVNFKTSATGYMFNTQPTNHDIYISGLTLDGQKYGFTGSGIGDALPHAWSWAVISPDIVQSASVTNRSGLNLFNLQTNSAIRNCLVRNFSDAGFRFYGAGTFPAVSVNTISIVNCASDENWLGFDVQNNAEYISLIGNHATANGRGFNVFAGNTQVGSIRVVSGGVGIYFGNGGSNPAHTTVAFAKINHCIFYAIINGCEEGVTITACDMLGNGALAITNSTGVMVAGNRIIGDSGSIFNLLGASAIVDGTGGSAGQNWFINNTLVAPVTPLRANGGILNMSRFFQGNKNIVITDTNTVFGPLLMPTLLPDMLLALGSATNATNVIIGTGLAYNTTTHTLTATAVSGGATNAIANTNGVGWASNNYALLIHGSIQATNDGTGNTVLATNGVLIASLGLFTDTSIGLIKGSTVQTTFITDVNNAKGYFDASASGYDWLLVNKVTGNVNLSVDGVAAQSADLQQWRDSGGVILARLGIDGSFKLSGVATLTNNGNLGSFAHLTNADGTASAIAIYDAGKGLIGLANGGNNTVLHGTTPPAYSAIVNADITAGTINSNRLDAATLAMFVRTNGLVGTETNAGNIAFLNAANVFTLSNRFTAPIAVEGLTANWLRITNAVTNDWLTASTVPYVGTTKVMVSSAVTPTELGHLVGLTVDANTLATTNAPTLYSPLFLGATAPVDNYVWTANGTTGLGQWEAAGAGSGDVTQAGANSITNAANLFAGRFWTNWNWLAASNITASSLIVSNSITNIALTASRVVVSGANKELASATTTTTEVNLLAGETRAVNTLAATNAPTLYNPILLSTAASANGYVWTASAAGGVAGWAAASGSGVTNNGQLYAMTNFNPTFTNGMQIGLNTNTQFSGTGNTNFIVNLTNSAAYETVSLTNDVNFIQTTNRVVGTIQDVRIRVNPNGTNRNVNVNANWKIRGITTTTVLYSTNTGFLDLHVWSGQAGSETNVFGDWTIY